MSQSVACALEILNRDGTRETRLFIRMINKFFDCLNVKSTQSAKLKRNDDIAPYRSSVDARFKVEVAIDYYTIYTYTCIATILELHLF